MHEFLYIRCSVVHTLVRKEYQKRIHVHVYVHVHVSAFLAGARFLRVTYRIQKMRKKTQDVPMLVK